MTLPASLRIGSAFFLVLVFAGACSQSVRGTQSSSGDGEGDMTGDGDGGAPGDGDGDAPGDGDGDAPGDGDMSGDGDGDGDMSGDGDASGDGDGDVSGDGGASGDGDGGDTGGTGGQDTGSGGRDVGSGGMPETTCADDVLESDTVSVNTALADNVVDLSCAPGTAPDILLEWVAPTNDYYVFDTAGSDYDTAVAILDGSCSGSELECSAGTVGGQFGRAVAKVERDVPYSIVVSGNSGDSGSAELSVAAVTCPDLDLTGQPLPATFTTVGAPDDFEVTCDQGSKSAQPERTFRYTADEATLYRFSASSEAFRPVIDVYEGVICGGEHLGCNAGQVGASAYPAEVTRFLEAGQSVTVIVQGENAAGEFDFDIQKLPAATSGGCRNPPELTSEVTGTVLADDPHEVSNSCDWAGNANGAYAEHVYKFAVNVSTPDICNVSVDFDGIGHAYILAGEKCSGPELKCVESVSQDPASFTFAPGDNGNYVLVVENLSTFGVEELDYTISSTCL